MKKIYISLLLLLGLLSSCDMDRKPYGTLDETTAIQSMNDLSRLRNGVYTRLRSMTAGGWVNYSDIQMDAFHGLITNGNRLGVMSTGQIVSSDGDLEVIFSGCYSVIAFSNYLIEQTEKFAEDPKFEGNLAEISRYNGEAHFLRAFAYFYLVDHFCQPYTQIDPDAAHSGIMLVTKFAPSGDISTYPSRSTLNESYKLIEEDLAIANEQLEKYDELFPDDVKPCSKTLNSYTAKAMTARVALVKGEYEKALNNAEAVLANKDYKLTTIDDYEKLWTEDEGTEVIFRPFMSNVEGLISTAAAWTDSDDETAADYIPTYGTLMMYELEDVRFDVFFKLWTLNLAGEDVDAYVFLKYPGNVSLRTTGKNNYVNMTKPFRLSEMYLVAAESAAILNKTDKASNYLNEFLSNRIVGFNDMSTVYPASKALAMAREQRQLEFIGEGFRMSDLRRLGQGFQRVEKHEESDVLDQYIVKTGAALKYTPGDYRFTWPIPKTEFDSNPNIKGQQNPGY